MPTRNIIGSWAYSGDPNASDRDQIRWLIGDVEIDDPLVSDAEITAALATEGTTDAAAAACCEFLAAFFRRDVDKSVSNPGGGSTSMSYSKRADQYTALAQTLRQGAALLVAPYCAALSVSEKNAVADDDDRVAPSFRRGLFEAPGTGATGDPDDEEYSR